MRKKNKTEKQRYICFLQPSEGMSKYILASKKKKDEDEHFI